MTQKWVWENENWTAFVVNKDILMPYLDVAVRAVAPLIKLAGELEPAKLAEFEGQVLLEETLSTSVIEKEYLDRDSVRSSIARHLGLPNAKDGDRRYESFTQVFFESIRTANQPLTISQLKKWHEMLFVEVPTFKTVTIGDFRDDEMSVVSGHFGRNEIVHFKAPCDRRECVEEYMSEFMGWLNNQSGISDYLRAAFAKFWFVTIHPFDDGNGRLSRIMAERCLAEADKTDRRLYSLSTEIEKNKSEYYDILERCQKGSGDITEWVIWFLERVKEAANNSMKRLDKVRLSTRFWDKYREVVFNERQRKLLIRLFETDDFEDGIAKRKYKNLVSTSDATAARDLTELVSVGALRKEGEGRGVKYYLNFR
ncbi:cell division protein Fic [Thiomicrorhabdus immobilis]|uniref:Cell division protein Fic n=1 Tax=Thiomicrorhabdus immobilis TaxID=2791037 RepID=A0ABN6CVR8_9GAMM|nr:Fic family protein [Thiomicrorhabdus immobilis]BCN93145.1 cell division protein Fic [Thiomicrorhabdus immobilis]